MVFNNVYLTDTVLEFEFVNVINFRYMLSKAWIDTFPRHSFAHLMNYFLVIFGELDTQPKISFLSLSYYVLNPFFPLT